MPTKIEAKQNKTSIQKLYQTSKMWKNVRFDMVMYGYRLKQNKPA